MILAARDPLSSEAETALETLCRNYWFPLYCFVRRRGYSPADAEDLTQGFFAKLLEKRYLNQAQREKGKFRTFLLTALAHYLSDERDRATALKRGGTVIHIELDDAEQRYADQRADGLTPEKVYERKWVNTLLERASACSTTDERMKPVQSICPECGKPFPQDAPGGLCPPCSLRVALSSPDMPSGDLGLAGSTLGHYELLSLAGQGGMGIVYKARDTHLDRTVAIKILPPETLVDPGRVRRFVQEAKAASALNHPNVVTIHDISDADGHYFIVMEFVEGKTLDKLIPGKGLPLSQALDYALQIVSGLAKAHEVGIIHRDLKPRNIIIGSDGRVKLLDFGLAKLVEAHPAVSETGTESGRILGTLAYMSPEQAEGRKVDGRSDLFAFGVVFHEMLTGRKTFFRSTMSSTLAAILREEAPPLEGVPGAVAEIIERCLRKRPEERFPNARELLRSIEAARSAPGQRALRPPPSVVVLPFTDLSLDPANDYFSDGLSEEIINALTRLPELRVIARTSAFAFRRQAVDIKEISARLNVSYVLEGSVRRLGNRVRVTAQLINSVDQCHLWSERYDRELTDIFAIQDEIARAITTALQVQLKPGQTLVKPPTRNLEAYNLYLLGRQHYYQLTPEAFQKAKDLFEQATRLDPEFALAYDALAELWWFLGFYGFMAPREAFSMGVWAALRAIETDDSLASPHAMLAMYRKELDYNWPEVQREFRLAFARDPKSPAVRFRHMLSGLLPAARLEEACAELEDLVRSDPLSPIVSAWLAAMLYFRRAYAEALEQGRRVLQLDPRNHFAHAFTGLTHAELGRFDEAEQALRLAEESSGGLPWVRSWLAYALGRSGKKHEACQILTRLEAQARSSYMLPTAIGIPYLGLGENDQALAWLDKAIEARDPFIVPLKIWPIFDPIRKSPLYPSLLRKMNMSE